MEPDATRVAADRERLAVGAEHQGVHANGRVGESEKLLTRGGNPEADASTHSGRGQRSSVEREG